MKIKDSIGREHTIEEYVQYQLICRDSGIAENAENTSENCAKAIGKLLNLLAEKGVLTSDEVKDIV